MFLAKNYGKCKNNINGKNNKNQQYQHRKKYEIIMKNVVIF